MKYAVFIVFLTFGSLFAQSNPGIIKGRITDSHSKAALRDVNISIIKTNYGASSDSTGNYTIRVPYGSYEIKFSYVGYKSKTAKVSLSKNNKEIEINVSLVPSVLLQSEVSVTARRESFVPSFQTIKEKDLDKMPTIFSDVMRSVKILPGVTSNNELTSAYNVRGGNFDENLIYLNGYEIYRPFLLQQGIEESQSIINGDLVDNLQFYSGAFPAEYGDKMSSVLSVEYKRNQKEKLSGTVRADLLNSGLTLENKSGNLNWSLGIRYAYPQLFSNVLQTKGAYHPTFKDVQLLSDYDLSSDSRLELFLLYADNKFDLTPSDWEGNFQLSFLDVKQVTLEFSGKQYYQFKNGLAGLRYIKKLNENSKFTTSVAFYNINENTNKNLSSNVFYSDDAYNPGTNREFLKTIYEYANNGLKINTFEVKSDYDLLRGNHDIKAGLNLKLTKMNNLFDESSYESGIDSVLNPPYSAYAVQNVNFNSISGYAEDEILLGEKWKANIGARVLKYYYNNETLFSPRTSIFYHYSPLHTLSFSWGVYYQPPFFYELHDKNLSTQKPLMAQKAVHYVLSWDNTFNKDMKFLVEVYYKKLSDLIPYYINQLQLVYSDANSGNGYAYGIDIQYEGELVEGMKTWIGYSYLNSKERNFGTSSGYQRSLLDQTNTVRIFLQDRVRKHPNFQSHVQFLFGSGYLFHPRKSVTDPSTGKNNIVVDYSNIWGYPFYFRVDMGLTYKFNLGDDGSLLITADVFNVFNKNNIASYSWYHVFPHTSQPVPVSNIYSPRFFNIGAELTF